MDFTHKELMIMLAAIRKNNYAASDSMLARYAKAKKGCSRTYPPPEVCSFALKRMKFGFAMNVKGVTDLEEYKEWEDARDSLQEKLRDYVKSGVF